MSCGQALDDEQGCMAAPTLPPGCLPLTVTQRPSAMLRSCQ